MTVDRDCPALSNTGEMCDASAELRCLMLVAIEGYVIPVCGQTPKAEPKPASTTMARKADAGRDMRTGTVSYSPRRPSSITSTLLLSRMVLILHHSAHPV